MKRIGSGGLSAWGTVSMAVLRAIPVCNRERGFNVSPRLVNEARWESTTAA
jgi:hypothetical protein